MGIFQKIVKSVMRKTNNCYVANGLNGNVGQIIQEKIPHIIDIKDVKSTLDENLTFLHLAAKSRGTYQELIDSNINYLLKSINFCKKNNIKNFIFCSAASIYNKNSIYELSKMMGEEVLKETNLNVLTLRLPMVLTKDSDHGILNRLIHKLSKHEEINLFNANQLFNHFINVSDISRFITNYNFSSNYLQVDFATDPKYSLLEIVLFLKKEINSNSHIVISDDSDKITHLSIDNVKSNFNYKPSDPKNILKEWLQIRHKDT